MSKENIRNENLARRKRLASEDCLERSFHIQERFLELPEFAMAASIGLYSPIQNEVFTEDIFRVARNQGKRLAYPRVRGSGMEFVEVTDRRELRPGAFGVLEPVGCRTLSPRSLDLLAVPGVGFDLQGFRLGYGKGFYDRVLHGFGRPGALVGLAFELQLVAELPVETHDVGMDLIVTEERVLRFAAVPQQKNRPA